MAACLLVVGSVVGVAQGQSGEAALAEARERFREGVELSDAGNDEAARLKFSQAWALFKSPPVLYNLARSEMRSGHHLHALEHFQQFVDAGPATKITDAQREKARTFIDELWSKLGQVQLDVPAGTVVTLDGKPVEDISRTRIAVAPGGHTFDAVNRGRFQSKNVDCPAGSIARVNIVFDRAAPPSGALDRGRVSSEGSGAGPARWIIPGALGVASLVGLGVGIGYGLASQSSKDEEDRLRRLYGFGACSSTGNTTACGAIQTTGEEVEARAKVATIGYATSAVLAVGALVTYLVWPTAKQAAPRVGVGPSAGGYMLSVEVVH
jgi:hypothetical protein